MDEEDVILVALALALSGERKSPRKRKTWAKNWLKERGRLFGTERLLTELSQNEPSDFQNYLRMDISTFDELLLLVTPYIQKRNTNMREAIRVNVDVVERDREKKRCIYLELI